MPKVRKLVDEHETMEPVLMHRMNKFVVIVAIVAAVFVVLYATVKIVKKEREKQKIDAIVSSIQKEIYLKQCSLDKMYCCGYNDKQACDNWVNAGCSESDGSTEINCDLKLDD